MDIESRSTWASGHRCDALLQVISNLPLARAENAPQLPDPILCARTNLDLEYKHVEARFSSMEPQSILGDVEDGGRRADEAERHVYKRVKREFCSGIAQRDETRKVFVLDEPLLAGQSLMTKSSAREHS